MARITIEDCLKNVNNRFTLIHMVARRVRQLRKGADPTITSKNRDIVIALREIAAGNIKVLSGEEAARRLADLPDMVSEESEQADMEMESA